MPTFLIVICVVYAVSVASICLLFAGVTKAAA
jgi:hypothetical protein